MGCLVLRRNGPQNGVFKRFPKEDRVATKIYLTNRRMPNGTYVGVRGQQR